MKYRLLSCLFSIILSANVTGQDSSKVISSEYFQSVSKSSNDLSNKIQRQSDKALVRMQKQEEKLRRKLSKIDSLAAQNIFVDAKSRYDQLNEKIKNTVSNSTYIPRLDTLVTSFKYLEQNQEWLEKTKDAKEKFYDAFEKVKDLQSKMQTAEDIKKFLKERKQYLKDQLTKFGLVKGLKKINKEVYYYGEQLNEYKSLLHDKSKREKKAWELLSKIKPFRDFMKKNSMLASLFRIPDANDPLSQVNMAGLQTRAQVTSLIQNQIGTGPNTQQSFRENIQQVQTQLQQLKNKIGNGGGSSDDDLPDFKPNGQKTKSFVQRLEYGMNLQMQKAHYYFPNTSDIGLSIGYKVNDKSVIGMGVSYKLGFGTGWRNIRFSQQGIGLRSYVDWKLKGSIWISGGMEMNYKSLFNSIDQLRNYSAWQKSGLVGISKTASVKSKLFKKIKVQLLWDYLSYKNVPKAQPIVFRVGYNLN